MNIKIFYFMKKIIFIKLLFCTFLINAQEQKNEIISKFDYEDFGSKEFFMQTFEGISKVDYNFSNVKNLVGKNFKFTIRKYKNGKLDFSQIIIDTKLENLPKIDKKFNFSIISQQTVGQQKIMFSFPTLRFERSDIGTSSATIKSISLSLTKPYINSYITLILTKGSFSSLFNIP